MTVTPFTFLNTINTTKQDVMDEDNEKLYVPFVINKSLSYFQDTVMIANELNRWHRIPNRMQYDLLLNMVRKRKRFAKWAKSNVTDDLEAVKQFYGYSNRKAMTALSLLTAEQICEIKEKVNKGGKSKR